MGFKRLGAPLRATSILMMISPEVSLGSDTAHPTRGPIRLHDGTKVPCAETPCEKDAINNTRATRNLKFLLRLSQQQ